MKTILLVLFYVLSVCQSESVFLDEGKSFDAEPTNTVKFSWKYIFFFKSNYIDIEEKKSALTVLSLDAIS